MRDGVLLAILLVAIGAAILLLGTSDGTVLGIEDGDFASLVYLGAWGSVLLGSALVLFRGRFGEAVRGGLLWGAAFAALIVAYAYSGDLAGVRDRVLGVLMPGHAVEVAGSQGRQYRVTRAGDDQFHVDGTIEGAAVSFVVDTGASVVALDSQTAARLGLDVAGLRYGADIMTANGVARAAMVRLDTVTVGGIERRNVQAAVTEGGLLGGTVLLGMSFLNTLTSFDFRGDSLVLTD